MMVRVETARSAAYYAACTAAADGTDLPGGRLPREGRRAPRRSSTAPPSALQIHGGVGFTWEYDVHLYFKRARSSESFLGDPSWHRERIAQRIGL